MNSFISEGDQETWKVDIYFRPLVIGCLEAGGSCIPSVTAVSEARANFIGQLNMNIVKQMLIYIITKLGKTAPHKSAKNTCTDFNILNA